MLAGLSTSWLSLANTLLACLVAGGMGVLAASITALDFQTLPLQIVPALAAALFARFTSFGIACAVGLALGMAQSLLLYYLAPQSWYPTDHGIALPGVWQLFVFVMIVIAMFVRGASLPGRGELIEKRLPIVPRPEHLTRSTVIGTVACAVALIVLPWDFRQALIVSLLGALICLSYVVITGFVGQISVVQLALAGVAGFTVSHMAVDFGIGFPLAPLIAVAVSTVLGLLVAVSALRVRGVSLAVVTLAAAVAIEQFGFVNSTWGGGSGASPVPTPKLFGFSLGPDSSFRGLDGNLPSPVFGFFLLAVIVLLCLLIANVRRSALGRQMLAVRSNERAAAAAGVNVTHRQAHRVRPVGTHRGRRGGDVQLQLRRRQRDAVRRAGGTRPARLRVRGRHHDDLGRDLRRPHLDRRACSRTRSTSGSGSRATGRCCSPASR